MSKSAIRAGGKFGGTHTTMCPAAAVAADVAAACEQVTNISPGIINNAPGKRGGRRNVKIVDVEGGILLVVTDGATHQEVRVYAGDTQEAKLFIAKGVRSAGLSISFGDRRKS